MMTLMGKLFRPWDLAAEALGNEPKSPSDHKTASSSSTSTSGVDFNSTKTAIQSGNKRKNDGNNCEESITPCKTAKTSPQRKSYLESPEKAIKTTTMTVEEVQEQQRKKEDLPKSCVKSRRGVPPSLKGVKDVSCCDNSSPYLSSTPILHGGGSEDRKYCGGEPLPLSPADFDYHMTMSMNMNSCSSASPSMFLYPNTINELASLSREELTAMGLLPPDPHANTNKVKRQRPKRFHCPHCQVAFSNNGQLRGHVRIHTGERPYKCEEEGCGKSFTRNEELTRHRRIHSGLRPFPCMYCGKKFGRKDHLKKHTRTHQRAMYSVSSSSLSLSPLPIGVGGMIGYGSNPFAGFHPPLLSSVHSGGSSDMNMLHSPYGLPFIPSVPPSASHFPLFS